jgi:hypothetical protein
MPLIRDYISEHDKVLDLGDHAFRALDNGDTDTATRLLEDARGALAKHFGVPAARKREPR